MKKRPARVPTSRLYGHGYDKRMSDIRVNDEIRQVLTEYPASLGLNFGEWARDVLLREAGREDLIPRRPGEEPKSGRGKR